MNLPEIFDGVAERMRSDLKIAREALEHRGLKGVAFEEIFREFLRPYLPRSLDISTGILVDSAGNASRQLDVIISDSAKTPIFYLVGNIRVIPIECAYAVIELKARLDSNEIDRIFENMKSVRALNKESYFVTGGTIRTRLTAYGQHWSIWPTNYYVFAYSSIKLKTIAELINSKHQDDQLPCHSRIDTVCVLDKGVICNQLPDGNRDALPIPNSKICIFETDRALLAFYTLISQYLNQAQIPAFRFVDYVFGTVSGDITVID